MAAEAFVRNKTHVNVGTIGHLTMAKTTLTPLSPKCRRSSKAQFRGYDSIDNAPEERARVSPLNRAQWNYRNRQARHYAHVDCPGHADYVKT